MSTVERANVSFAILTSVFALRLQGAHGSRGMRRAIDYELFGRWFLMWRELESLSLSFDVKTPWCVDSVCYKRCVSQPKVPAVVLFPEPTYRGVEH